MPGMREPPHRILVLTRRMSFAVASPIQSRRGDGDNLHACLERVGCHSEFIPNSVHYGRRGWVSHVPVSPMIVLDQRGACFLAVPDSIKFLLRNSQTVLFTGRSSSRNWRNDDHPSNDEKTEPSNDRESSREGIRSSVDRGRGRGRGRGGFRGNMSRGLFSFTFM